MARELARAFRVGYVQLTKLELIRLAGVARNGQSLLDCLELVGVAGVIYTK